MSETADFVVVGGGAAGAIIAARLAGTGRHQVLLLEAGRSDVGDPKALNMSRLEDQDKSYDWGYEAETIAGSGRRISYARARMLGGCANHNDCAFIAPPPPDMENWVRLGAKGWGPGDVAGAFARVAAAIHIETSPPGNDLSRAFIDAAKQCGLPERNFREAVQPGTGWFPLNARGDLRQSSSVAYLHPILGNALNLRVLTDCMATRLLFDGMRAIGVATARGDIFARREVILCGGSINSPQLMMLSGLGPAAHLREHGIPVKQDMPGVGQNLIDHVAANIACELREPSPLWARTPCEATALVQVDADAPAPDVLFHFVLRLREKYVGGGQFVGIPHGVKLSPNVARPKSRGSMKLKSPDPHAVPEISLNYLSDAEGYDRRILTSGLRIARQIAKAPALAPWLAREVAPGPACQSDADFLAYILETCETVYHPLGTCRMGASDDPLAVVTPDLKVKGLQGLRIADASVFPDMVTVNINNTVMMLAERAQELILAQD
jgi:choline oxidase